MFNKCVEIIEEKNKEIMELLPYKLTNEYVKGRLMKSNIPIGEVCFLMSLLNYPEDKTCRNDSYFWGEEYINKDLRKYLEVI